MFSGKGLNQIEEEKDRKVTLYVLNNFIKFERKLYQFAGIPFGRPIKIKTLGYFFGILIIGLIIYFTPGLKLLIRWIPPGLLILVPITVAWLLSDLGTEGRSPIRFFSSFFKYQYRKISGSLHYRNKKIPKFRTYTFNNFISHSKFNFATSGMDISEVNQIDLHDEQKKEEIMTMSKNKNSDKATSQDENNQYSFSEKLNIADDGSDKESVSSTVNNIKEKKITEDDDIFGYLFQSNDEETVEFKDRIPSSDVDVKEQSEDVIDILLNNNDKDTIYNEEVVDKVQTDTHISDEIIAIDNVSVERERNELDSKKREDKIIKKPVNTTKKNKNKVAKEGLSLSKKHFYKKLLLFGVGGVALITIFSVGILFAINLGDSNGAVADDKNVENNNDLNLNEEDYLLSGIKASSRQDYEEATEHFDKVNFETLEKDDKEIVLLSYLYTDQVKKIIELEPNFADVVVSYYQAKDNFSILRSHQDLSDEFKFALAVEDDNYIEIIELRKNVKLDEEKEVAIIKAYVNLDELEGALDFAKEIENTRYIKQLESLIEENKGDDKKENDDD